MQWICKNMHQYAQICKKYVRNMQEICKKYARNMQTICINMQKKPKICQ